MKVCGIDPGSKGAMCVLDSKNPAYLAILDLDNITSYGIGNWLFKQKPDIILIEDVHSVFGVSAKANFSFGFNLGIVHAISNIVLSGGTPMLVQPKVWQKEIGVSVTGGKFIKQQVSELVKTYYPNADIYGKKGALKDGRSDAIMIAHYGILKYPDR